MRPRPVRPNRSRSSRRRRSRPVAVLVAAGAALALVAAACTDDPAGTASPTTEPGGTPATSASGAAAAELPGGGAAPSGSSTAPSGSSTAGSGSTGARLQAALTRMVQRADGPVGAIAVIDDGTSVTVRTAGGVRPGARAPRPTDHVRVASLSKAMAGAAAYALVEDGTLSLDDTVGRWRPDLPQAWQPVTLRQVLTHTSGIPDFGKSQGFGDAVRKSPGAALPPTQILAFAPPTLDFEPGERYEYSNSNPFVTGLVIEAATGKTYTEVLREKVLGPLGMTSTSLPGPDDTAVPAPLMRGYDAATDGTTSDVTDAVAFGGWAWASGGVVSTPADLTRFVQGWVGGAVVDGALQDRQFRFVVPGSSEPQGPGSNGAGPALFRYVTRCGTVYGHTGSILGYTQFMAATRDGRRSAVLSISTQYGDELLPSLRDAMELSVCGALGR